MALWNPFRKNKALRLSFAQRDFNLGAEEQEFMRQALIRARHSSDDLQQFQNYLAETWKVHEEFLRLHKGAFDNLPSSPTEEQWGAHKALAKQARKFYEERVRPKTEALHNVLRHAKREANTAEQLVAHLEKVLSEHHAYYDAAFRSSNSRTYEEFMGKQGFVRQ